METEILMQPSLVDLDLGVLCWHPLPPKKQIDQNRLTSDANKQKLRQLYERP